MPAGPVSDGGFKVSQRASARVTISNRLGFHARPATAFAQTAMEFKCNVLVKGPDEEIDGKSVMQILMLGATKGTELEICTDGPDADECLKSLCDLVKAGFGEE